MFVCWTEKKNVNDVKKQITNILHINVKFRTFSRNYNLKNLCNGTMVLGRFVSPRTCQIRPYLIKYILYLPNLFQQKIIDKKQMVLKLHDRSGIAIYQMITATVFVLLDTSDNGFS